MNKPAGELGRVAECQASKSLKVKPSALALLSAGNCVVVEDGRQDVSAS